MIKSNEEVTLKTQVSPSKTYFLYRKPQTKNCGKCFSKHFEKYFENFLDKSYSAEKKRKVASYRRNNKLGVSFQIG